MDENKEYYAFISYKREDKNEARQLQRALEYYRLPNHLRRDNSELPEYVRPVFRDMTDLEVGELSAQIHSALESSHFLIVVCSPRVTTSKWVNDEVEYFMSLGKQDKIIPYIIEGIPHADNPQEECYPPALLKLSKEKEVLGANINEIGRGSAIIRVISRMFNIRYDTLFRRYEREQRRKRWMWIGCSIIVALLGLFIGGYFVRQNSKLKISQSHFIAEKAAVLRKEGDVFLAMRLLLSRTQSDLLIPEVEYGLRKTYNIIEEGIAPVSITGAPFPKGRSYFIIVNIEATKDGSKYVYTKEKSLVVVDSRNGKTLLEKKWSDTIYNVKFCNNDKYIVISDGSGKVYILDSSNCQVLHTLIVGDKIVEDIATNDESGIIAVCSDKKVKIWDYQGKQLQSFEFDEYVRYLVCHQNGHLIAVSNGNKVDLYDVTANRVICSFPHNGFCYDADFSSSGQLVSTCSDDCTVKVWNVKDGTLVRQFQLNDYVSTAIFGETDTCLVAKSGYDQNAEIRLLNISNGSIGDIIRGQNLVKIGGEPIVVEEFTDGSIYIYSPLSHNRRLRIPTNGEIRNLDLKGDRALISTTEGLTRLWYIGSDKTSKVLGHSYYVKTPIRDIQMNKNGTIVATAGSDNMIKLWSYPEFNDMGTFIGHKGQPYTIRFSSNEKFIVSSSYDKTAIIWDVNTKLPVHIMSHNEYVDKADFIDDDNYVVTTSGHSVILWSTDSGEIIREMHIDRTSPRPLESWEPDGDDVIDVIYDDRSEKFFVSYRNGIIRVWSFNGEIIKEINAHNQAAEICYSPKLGKLISWSENGELYVWDTASFDLTSLEGHLGDVTKAKLLQNGYELLSSDSNGDIFQWDLRTMQLKRKLCSLLSGVGEFNISDNEQYLVALTYDNLLKVISISDGVLRMDYENADFYVCPVMNRRCDAIIAPLENGWINEYEFPNFRDLIIKIQYLLGDTSMSEEEKRKHLFE